MGKLAVVKTTQNELSVDSFLDSITNEQQRKDSQLILKMMEKTTKEKPKMWGGKDDQRYSKMKPNKLFTAALV